MELVANALEGPDLSELVQIVYERNYVSIFLYHPEARVIEEVSVSLDALEAYDFDAARIAAAALEDIPAVVT